PAHEGSAEPWPGLLPGSMVGRLPGHERVTVKLSWSVTRRRADDRRGRRRSARERPGDLVGHASCNDLVALFRDMAEVDVEGVGGGGEHVADVAKAGRGRRPADGGVDLLEEVGAPPVGLYALALLGGERLVHE